MVSFIPDVTSLNIISTTVLNVGCGGIYIEDLGTIKSPNHPGIYPGETNCKWIIQAPPTHVVQLTFLHFKLEQSHSCNYDHLTIYDVNDKLQNDGQIGKFCGGKLPPTLLSTSNSMRIVFESDASHSGEGFLATYVFIAEDNGKDFRFEIITRICEVLNSSLWWDLFH